MLIELLNLKSEINSYLTTKLQGTTFLLVVQEANNEFRNIHALLCIYYTVTPTHLYGIQNLKNTGF